MSCSSFATCCDTTTGPGVSTEGDSTCPEMVAAMTVGGRDAQADRSSAARNQSRRRLARDRSSRSTGPADSKCREQGSKQRVLQPSVAQQAVLPWATDTHTINPPPPGWPSGWIRGASVRCMLGCVHMQVDVLSMERSQLHQNLPLACTSNGGKVCASSAPNKTTAHCVLLRPTPAVTLSCNRRHICFYAYDMFVVPMLSPELSAALSPAPPFSVGAASPAGIDRCNRAISASICAQAAPMSLVLLVKLCHLASRSVRSAPTAVCCSFRSRLT